MNRRFFPAYMAVKFGLSFRALETLCDMYGMQWRRLLIAHENRQDISVHVSNLLSKWERELSSLSYPESVKAAFQVFAPRPLTLDEISILLGWRSLIVKKDKYFAPIDLDALIRSGGPSNFGKLRQVILSSCAPVGRSTESLEAFLRTERERLTREPLDWLRYSCKVESAARGTIAETAKVLERLKVNYLEESTGTPAILDRDENEGLPFLLTSWRIDAITMAYLSKINSGLWRVYLDFEGQISRGSMEIFEIWASAYSWFFDDYEKCSSAQERLDLLCSTFFSQWPPRRLTSLIIKGTWQVDADLAGTGKKVIDKRLRYLYELTKDPEATLRLILTLDEASDGMDIEQHRQTYSMQAGSEWDVDRRW